jgi:hypothetical protein
MLVIRYTVTNSTNFPLGKPCGFSYLQFSQRAHVASIQNSVLFILFNNPSHRHKQQPWLHNSILCTRRQWNASVSLQIPGKVGFVVDNFALRQISSKCIGFPCQISFNNCSKFMVALIYHSASNRNEYRKHEKIMFLGSKVLPVREANNLTVIYEPIV